ncbi:MULTISPECIES: class I SAM-dependent RNA methyltransferase [Alphaproteobacteria]|uniref:RNA methyltransferase n=2 Tax=Alphaproteobacteria TaxID=28211 RepID=A0ABQ6EIC5_9SPHN|nr:MULTISPECIES: class I SAM-dependent RNA methyltransferase [Alphaproteobacteria]GEO84100.1 putative RNA methyltransferase [Ciceribacter naphthalenivorans]GLR24636.1 putative RNA methyltransferase [Ciceribacter naphthalenivorans]GLT07492.1 putative RNA methyltransferase [Sphingomonas psychrolutea]
MSAETVTIDSLGAQGDGIFYASNGPVYVPFSLPGETLAIARVKDHGTIMSYGETSPDRITPACRHFGPDGKGGSCGGCSLQHMAKPAYNAFKRSLVVAALKSKGIDVPVGDLIEAHPGERRRVVFAARSTEKGLLIGFNQAESHHIVAIEECPIASPGILAGLEALKKIGNAAATTAEPFRMTVIETLTGLDVAIDGIKKLSDKERRAITETVLAMRGIARVAFNGEIVIEQRKPLIDMSGVSVAPPPGAFTQATVAAEEAMVRLTLEHIGKVKRVADLFAGVGTFALRLARIAQVHAVESEERALKALDHAARNTQGLKPVSVERRDLFRRPLMVSELKTFDAVIFDPPRAGAEEQCKELARSVVKKIVAVSCNPLTLARDLSILTAAGYRITSVTPIDQFLWTSHVEVVATLVKG